MMPFNEISFSVPLDNMSAKVVDIRYDGRELYPARIMSLAEWEEWLRNQ
jgi:hypothetical protein